MSVEGLSGGGSEGYNGDISSSAASGWSKEINDEGDLIRNDGMKNEIVMKNKKNSVLILSLR